MSNSNKVILDLCGGTGSWSKPYAKAGYIVLVIDPHNGIFDDIGTTARCRDDVRKIEYLEHLSNKVHGILCAPPCTVFANSGARWPRTEAEMLEGISIMDACLRFVTLYKPKWWVLENPIGKMRKYLGPPKMTFDPCDYGDPYTKRTLLWGDFVPPIKNRVEPVLGSKMHLKYGGKSQRTKTLRSATPQGFAKAFFIANP